MVALVRNLGLGPAHEDCFNPTEIVFVYFPSYFLANRLLRMVQCFSREMKMASVDKFE